MITTTRVNGLRPGDDRPESAAWGLDTATPGWRDNNQSDDETFYSVEAIPAKSSCAARRGAGADGSTHRSSAFPGTDWDGASSRSAACGCRCETARTLRRGWFHRE